MDDRLVARDGFGNHLSSAAAPAGSFAVPDRDEDIALAQHDLAGHFIHRHVWVIGEDHGVGPVEELLAVLQRYAQ